jgi:hypothetical protein
VDPRADIYALGLVLHDALASARAHHGDEINVLYHAVYVDPRNARRTAREPSGGLAPVRAAR